MAEPMDLSPGLFQLDLPVNKEDTAYKDAIGPKMIDIGQALKTHSDKPEELALLNLSGLFNFRLENYGDAEENFQSVLKKDPNNLNAIANLLYLLEKLERNREVKRLRKKYQDLMQAPNPGTRARCLAEQAYAFSFGINVDRGEKERQLKSNEIFSTALSEAGNHADESEKDFWKFYMAINARKIFSNYNLNPSTPPRCMENMKTAVTLSYEIITREPGDVEYKWESWRNLADTFRKIKSRPHMWPDELPQELRQYLEKPEKCMEEALKLAPNNPHLLARYANFLYSIDKNRIKEVLQLLQKSIDKDQSEYNYIAFNIRGRIVTRNMVYNVQKTGIDHPHYKMRLEMARDDLQRAIKYRNATWDLLEIATVYHLFALCLSDETFESRRKYMKKELEYLTRAQDREKGSRQKTALVARGQFYFECGEYRKSVACYEQVLEKMHEQSSDIGHFMNMFKSYFCLLRNVSNKSKMLDNMAECLKQGITRYGTSKIIGGRFNYLLEKYKEEVLILRQHCESIPDSGALVKVLTNEEPLSPDAKPLQDGGRLQHIWFEPSDWMEDAAGNDEDGSSERSFPQVTDGRAGKQPLSEEAEKEWNDFRAVVPTAGAASAAAAASNQPPVHLHQIVIHHPTNSPIIFGAGVGNTFNYATSQPAALGAATSTVRGLEDGMKIAALDRELSSLHVKSEEEQSH